ncbi:MAG TPA: potassium channel family protein, partial [Gaiellaceae bacterium]|nr:potassium channel family protein [Gaiellaceae bacterium]
MRGNPRLTQIGRLLAAVALALGAGTIGFHSVLHESWFQSLYRAVITSTLTGLDTVPSSDGARALSIVMVLAGLTIIAYAGAVIVEVIAGGVLTGVLSDRRRDRTIKRLRDHFIICGYGRVGRRVAEEFRAAGVSYVVLDFNEDAVAVAKERGELLVEGNATEDEDLRRAGLEYAKGLVAAADSDADNLYISLSARSARPDLQIVARASDEDAEKKLHLAGADRVVLPYRAAGRTMASLVLKPQVTDFLDVVTTATGPDLHLAEIEVHRT